MGTSLHDSAVQRPSLAQLQSPVVFWAATGAVFMCLTAYVFGAWMLSPEFRPVPVGNDPMPPNVALTLAVVQVVAGAVGLFMLTKFVFLPLVREKRLSMDGMLVINFLLLWWTDPIDNYVNFTFMYNGYALNMGSWAKFIPGFGYPKPENFPEPLLMMGGFYLGYNMLNALLGCWFLRKLGEWSPAMPTWKKLVLLFIPLAIIDLVIEVSILRTGMAAYPGVVQSISLFPGKVYQFPLYEPFIIAFICTGFTCLRYFRDDKGRFFVEKGIDRLQLSQGKKSVVTFLALAGFCQPFFLIGYYLPYNLFAIHADTFPAYPSYMRNEMCGEGTDYACPSREWVPIPAIDTKLFVRPDDPRLPLEVRNKQGISTLEKDPYAAD